MSTSASVPTRRSKKFLYFFYPKNVDYMDYIDKFNNFAKYEDCMKSARSRPVQSSDIISNKRLLTVCGAQAESDLRFEIARLTIPVDNDETYDVPAGIVYTRVSNEKQIQPNEMIVKTVQTSRAPNTIISKPVTIADIFTPHYTGSEKSLCEAIGEMTNSVLSATSYVVNDAPNPRFIEAECIDIHAKINMGKIIDREADEITRIQLQSDGKSFSRTGEVYNLMVDKHYEDYCASQRGSQKSCEAVKSWMKISPDQKPEDIQPLCSFTAGRIFQNTCVPDADKMAAIKTRIRNNINKCIAEYGCITDTHGKSSTQKKFMRLDTADNFKHSDKAPTQICCRRSFRAVVIGKLTMDRLYKITGNMSFSEQLELINKSRMTDDEKRMFLSSVQDSHEIGEKLIKHLNIGGRENVAEFMNSFASIVREAIHGEMKKFTMVEGSGKDHPETDEESETVREKLTEITGEEASKPSILMSMLKGVASTVKKAIIAVAKILYKTIRYFLKKGFDLLTWLFHHPTTAMWLAYAALYFKKKCCEMISLRIYGSPEMIDIGIFGKTKEFATENLLATGAIIKKYFLQKAFEFVDSAGFSSYVSYMTNIAETGILGVIGLIQPIGPIIALNIKMSGGLSVVLTILASTFREAMTYAFHAMLLKEAGDDLLTIITGTCIAPPKPTTQITIKGVLDEAKIATDYVSDTVSDGASKILDVAGSATDQLHTFATSILQSMKFLT